MAGFPLKNPSGFNVNPVNSQGITGKSSTRGTGMVCFPIRFAASLAVHLDSALVVCIVQLGIGPTWQMVSPTKEMSICKLAFL
jgi:hypothetical protein